MDELVTMGIASEKHRFNASWNVVSLPGGMPYVVVL
jgi:hypothetical protein